MGNKDKFIGKNHSSIDRLLKSKDKVKYVILSNTLAMYIENYYGMEIIDSVGKWEDIKFIISPYVSDYYMDVILNGNSTQYFDGLRIEFDVPCVCGYFKGEGHNLGNHLS